MSTSSEKLVQQAVARLHQMREAGEDHLPEDERIDLKNFTSDELRTVVIEGYAEKAFRADQIFEWMYRHLAGSFDEMTNLSKAFRQRLEKTARVTPITPHGAHPAKDGTTKLTFRCDDEAVVESVFIPFESHNALCISSQVGCAMGCTFCFTARMGLVRHLSTAEIVEQVVQARRRAAEQNGESVTNIVFMGMGEPLHNIENVLRACQIVTDQKGLDFSRRRVTVSTSGLVPAMERFIAESEVQLAVSLNATTDVQRSKIMPVNDRWNLDTLLESLRNLPLERRQRVTLEYVLLAGFNDTEEDADRLVDLTRGIPCKINIIPFNPHPDTPFETPSEEAIDRFQRHLNERNVSCFRRRTRGRDEMAACGQLGQPGKRAPKHVRDRIEAFRSRGAQ